MLGPSRAAGHNRGLSMGAAPFHMSLSSMSSRTPNSHIFVVSSSSATSSSIVPQLALPPSLGLSSLSKASPRWRSRRRFDAVGGGGAGTSHENSARGGAGAGSGVSGLSGLGLIGSGLGSSGLSTSGRPRVPSASRHAQHRRFHSISTSEELGRDMANLLVDFSRGSARASCGAIEFLTDHSSAGPSAHVSSVDPALADVDEVEEREVDNPDHEDDR